MSLSCFLRLGNGPVLRRFGANPLWPDSRGPLPFLVVAKPARSTPVQTALQTLSDTEQLPRSCDRAEKVERSALKLLRTILLLSLLGCGFGVQHIAYTRQMNKLSRQLQRKEVELRAVTQAYRTLESVEALRGAEEVRQIEMRQVVVKHNARTVVPGG